MKGTPNVVRRGGQIHFRRQVPKHLIGVVGRREIMVSLRTGDYRLGKLRSRCLYLASEDLFSAVGVDMLSEEDIVRLVQDFYNLAAQIDNLSRLHSPPLTVDEHSSLVTSLAEHRKSTAAELGRGDFGLGALGASIVAKRAGLTLNTVEVRQLQQA